MTARHLSPFCQWDITNQTGSLKKPRSPLCLGAGGQTGPPSVWWGACALPASTSWLRTRLFHNSETQKRRETRPKLHSARNRWGGEFPGPPFLVSSLSCRPRPPDIKPNSKLARRADYIRRLSLSPQPLRRPPLRQLATSPRPACSPAPAGRRVPRGGGGAPATENGPGGAARRRHGGRRLPRPWPAGSAAAAGPRPCLSDPSTPGPAAPTPRRPRDRVRPPTGQRCSPWWRMAVDSPRQIRARQVAPRMAATRAEENADVNTRLFIRQRRLGVSSERAAGAGPSGSTRRRVGALSRDLPAPAQPLSQVRSAWCVWISQGPWSAPRRVHASGMQHSGAQRASF